MNTRIPTWLLLVAALCLPLVATAGEKTSGAYTIHYNALPTRSLPAESAARYDLAREPNQGMLIVTVLDDSGNTPAKVTGHASTLTGEEVAIAFHSVAAGSSMSTLGTFTIPGSGTLRFELEVTPRDGKATKLRFVQDFVVP